MPREAAIKTFILTPPSVRVTVKGNHVVGVDGITWGIQGTIELPLTGEEWEKVRQRIVAQGWLVSDPFPALPPSTRALYRCASPNCPGYTYKASDMPHPPSTCR